MAPKKGAAAAAAAAAVTTSSGAVATPTTAEFAAESALAVPLLHAAKFPNAAVVGLLLGTTTSKVEIKDAVPLFHSVPTAASMEVAVLLAEEHAIDTGLAVVGMYCAPESDPSEAENLDVPVLYSRMATELANRYRSAGRPIVLLVVDNAALADEARELLPFSFRTLRGGDWTSPTSGGSVTTASANWNARFTALLRSGAASRLVDVDDALDDASLDWRNPGLVSSS